MDVIVKEGELLKCSRNRGLDGEHFRPRLFKLFENAKLEYYDDGRLCGNFDIKNGSSQILSAQKCGEKENAFEITTSNGEKILLIAYSLEDLKEWIFWMELVTEGKYRWYRHVEALSGHLSLQLPLGQHLEVLFDEPALLAAMKSEGYGHDRLNELLEDYFKNLNNHIARFVLEDPTFAQLCRDKFTAYKIRLTQHCPTNDSANFRTKFSDDGILEVYFSTIWSNVASVGSDLPTSLFVGDIPYLAWKSRNCLQPALDDRIRTLEQFVANNDTLRVAVKEWCEHRDSAIGMYGEIHDWDTSNVTDMKGLFQDQKDFNDDISKWNVSKVTDMSDMFYGATSFNQPLNAWDVSNVTNMESVFHYATAFNQPLNDWNVSMVQEMSYMFSNASNFNQPLNRWNVGNVTGMMNMFSSAISFDQPLDEWNVSNVTDLSGMFSDFHYSDLYNL